MQNSVYSDVYSVAGGAVEDAVVGLTCITIGVVDAATRVGSIGEDIFLPSFNKLS